MKRCYLQIAAVALTAAVFASPALAQKFELHPYGGGAFWGDFRAHPDQIEKFKMTNPAIWGLRGGFFPTPNLQVEGNAGYLTQFRPRNGVNPSIGGMQYEGGLVYNFGQTGKVFPFIAGAVGSLVLDVSNPNNPASPEEVTYLAIVPPFTNGGPIPFTSRQLTMQDGDAFLTFSYGGGIKGQRLWGPLGFRVELRGRTMPNFYGDTISALEPTGGILFSWGER